MKAVLVSIGTRGDVEPFLAVAQILKARNWEVVCVFPEQFRSTVEAMDLPFHGFTKEFLEIIESREGKMVMGGQGAWWERARAFWTMARKGMKMQKVLLKQQHEIQLAEKPDRLIYHPKCLLSLIWGLQNPGKTIQISPIPCLIHPVDHWSAIGMKGSKNYGRRINRLTYQALNFIKINYLFRASKSLHKEYPEVRITQKRLRKAAMQEVKTLYAISLSLFPRPLYWPDLAHVVGYHERDKTLNWEPEEPLLQFLDQHEKVVFISFGSMANADPKGKTRIILDVLEKHRIPAILNTSWGGLERPEKAPDHLFFVQDIPYDWIFEKVYAVVHHGGSGTTHSGLKYACPTMIVPHIVDQFFWDKIIAGLKLGPKGIPIKKLKRSTFEKAILDLLTNPEYLQNCQRVSENMVAESDPERYYQLIAE